MRSRWYGVSKLLVIDGLSETCMCKHCEMDPSKERESAGAWPGARARSMPGGDSHLNLYKVHEHFEQAIDTWERE